MPAKKTPKGKPYSRNQVNAILKAGGKKLKGPKSKKKNCWRVDLKTLDTAILGLAIAGKTVMRFFVTKDVPGKSPGEVIDPTTHLLFLETASGCLEQFPPTEMP